MTASLLIVFSVAKLAMIAGREMPGSVWTPIALLWHDAALVLAFAGFERLFRQRRRTVRSLYATLVVYAAVNVPVSRDLSTPLTWPMIGAAGWPLADSIKGNATWASGALVAGIVALGVVVPPALRPGAIPVRWTVTAVAALTTLGPFAAGRVDTRGLERSAWSAIVTTAFPYVVPRPATGQWRASRTSTRTEDTLSTLAGSAAGRNIVLVSLESTAAQYLGLYGATPDVAPNLSALARAGYVFDAAYAVYPESIKGLLSVLCSTYPAFDSSAERYARVPCEALPAKLAGVGYRTGLFHSGRFGYLGMEAIVRGRGYEVLEDAGDIGGNRESSFGVDEPATVDRMLAWIDSLEPNERFFLTYLPIAGHHPYETPGSGPYPDADEFGRYRNALWHGDRALGQLMRGLAARGLDRNTLWIVIGDHGEAFGQHDANYGHTFQLYDENVRVPFVIAAPGAYFRTIRVRRVISLIDTAPTILSLIGEPIPAGHQGVSVLDAAARGALFFTDYSRGLVGIRDGPMKLIHDLRSRRSNLFDVVNDPSERNDLSATHPGLVRAYEGTLKDWSAAQKHRVLHSGG